MKRIIELSVSIKYMAGFTFMLLMAFYCAFDFWLIGAEAIPLGVFFQGVFLSFILAIQQFICFTDHILKEANNTKRLLLFSIKLYITFIIFAVGFHWFPMTVRNWLIFTYVFLVLFAVIGAAYAVYFKITGHKYNALLSAYHSRQDV